MPECLGTAPRKARADMSPVLSRATRLGLPSAAAASCKGGLAKEEPGRRARDSARRPGRRPGLLLAVYRELCAVLGNSRRIPDPAAELKLAERTGQGR